MKIWKDGTYTPSLNLRMTVMILYMFVIINEPILLHYFYLLHSDYMSFYLRYRITFTCVPLGFSWLWQFLRLSCFWMRFCRIPSTEICLMFFSCQIEFMIYWGEDHNYKVFLSHNIETYYQHDLSLLILPLITWLWYSPLQSYSFPFHNFILYSLEGSHYTELTLQEWDAWILSLRGKNLHKLNENFLTERFVFPVIYFSDYLNYSYLYELRQVYSDQYTGLILWVLIQYYFILLLKLFQFWPLGSLVDPYFSLK